MFILYAVIAGLVIGVLSGGSAGRLGDLRFAWAPLIVVGLMGQVLLFSTPLGDALGPARPVPVHRLERGRPGGGLAQPGDPGPATRPIGGTSNLIAICANGGYMPVSPAALQAMGRLPKEGYTNSRLVDGVVLGPLTDLFAMPAWLPVANVFSVGDVLIGVGAAIAIVAAMHGRGPLERRAEPATPSGEPA